MSDTSRNRYSHKDCPSFDDPDAVLSWHRNEIDYLKNELTKAQEQSASYNELTRRLAAAEAEIERMRPVVEAAKNEPLGGDITTELKVALRDYEAGKKP